MVGTQQNVGPLVRSSTRIINYIFIGNSIFIYIILNIIFYIILTSYQQNTRILNIKLPMEVSMKKKTITKLL